MGRFCKKCNEEHEDVFWIPQRERGGQQSFRCRIWRTFTRLKNSKISFEEHRLKFKSKKLNPKKSKEELRELKRQYDSQRRANYTEEDRNFLKECNKRYHDSEKGKKAIRRANEKRTSTPEGLLASRMRAHIYYRMISEKQGQLRYLPYTIEDLKRHLESKFNGGINWDNRKLWDIDHVIPLKFKNEDGSYYWNQPELADPTSETFQRAWALGNLQPMWRIPNIKKSNKRIG